MKNKLKILWIIPIGIIFYGCIYLYSRRSEGFKFIQERYSHSVLVENRIGEVKSVELPLFGTFKEKHVNSKVFLTARVRCVSGKGTVLIDVIAEKNPEWEIKEEKLESEQLVSWIKYFVGWKSAATSDKSAQY